MELHLTIADDADLRAFVKEEIKGAVKSITRQEIIGMIVAEISSKTRNVDSLFDAELRKQVTSRLAGNMWTKGEMEVVLRDEISKALRAYFAKA